MLVDYFYWQFIAAPRWLIEFVWTLQRAAVRLFSVSIMLRTLFAPWHRDTLAFHGGGLGELGLTMLWNVISRLIGLLFRLAVLTAWLFAEVLLIVAALAAIPAFLLWPALVIIGLAASLAVII